MANEVGEIQAKHEAEITKLEKRLKEVKGY
jgi:hypothetical protein